MNLEYNWLCSRILLPFHSSFPSALFLEVLLVLSLRLEADVKILSCSLCLGAVSVLCVFFCKLILNLALNRAHI